jgi:hypothetical protein
MTALITLPEHHGFKIASDRQVEFITTLLADYAKFGDEYAEEARSGFTTLRDQFRAGEFTMSMASALIEQLKDLNRRLRAEARESEEALPEIPTGRYAYQKDTEDPEDIAFFHVVVTKKGFPLLWIYTPMEEIAVKNRAQKRTILKKIEELGPFQCELLFGQKIGVCSRCGTELTNQQSREYGMGPICRNK